MTTGVHLSFPAPLPPWSQNQERRWHWAKVGRHHEEYQDTTAWAVKALPATLRADLKDRQLHVQVHIIFTANRTRDPHNYASTVAKGVVDGLVRAKLVPDDNHEWVCHVEVLLGVNRELASPMIEVGLEPNYHTKEERDE